MLNARQPRRSEQGVALLAAIAVLVIASFIIVGIMVASRASGDATRSKLEESAALQLARDAATMLSASYSSLTSGEFDAFSPGQAVLAQHASKIGGSVVPNTTLPGALKDVDTMHVAATSRFAIRQPLEDGRTGWWQIYSIGVPIWGTTPGGRVVAYVRVWTTDAPGRVSQPSLYRIDLRPQWFADYQMLFDGPTRVLSGATLNGRVHSNGFNVSYYDQLRAQFAAGQMISVEGTATCTSSARITVATGSVVGGGGCPARSKASTSRFNLLRARDTASRLRYICTNVAHPSLSMACPTTTQPVKVVLSGTQVYVDGTALNAAVTGNTPGSNQGAVVVANGDIHLSGVLAPRARAMIITAAQDTSSSYGTGGAPSVWVTGNGNIGSDAAATSSFGIVAEGDVIFDETQACNITMRGALLAMSGMLSSHPTWRSPVLVSGGTMCGAARLYGSIASHYAPVLNNPDNFSGFATREYAWLTNLYDNPPPMYPTAADWEAMKLEPANLDCFGAGQGGALDTSRRDCL